MDTNLLCWEHSQSIVFYFLSLNVLSVCKSSTIIYPALQFHGNFPHSLWIKDLKIFDIPCEIEELLHVEKT